MGFEQKINQKLNKYPKAKKLIKNIYQHAMYAISSHKNYEGDIKRLSPDDSNHEYFFGYYDKSPWDATGRYVLCLKAKDTWSDVAPKDKVDILIIDTKDNNRVIKVAESNAWNVQQGCMAQWLGPDFKNQIIYNDFRNGNFVSVILNVFSLEERILSMPIYSVAKDGSFALSLDFARLHRLRPGYGYANIEEKTKNEKLPESTCIWKIDIKNNIITSVLTYKNFACFEPRKEMIDAEHKVNHIMVSPNGKRFMVLHRWFNGSRKYSRLVTVNIDGTNMYNLSDDDMVSHCYWRDDNTIIAFENKKKTGAGYYLMTDMSHDYKHLWPHISSDGHPSYSPDGKLVVTDTYPNRNRMAILKILNENFNIVVGKAFAPFKYDNDTRCDLHPRWSRDGKKICFDSVHEGHRGLYVINVDGIRFAYSDTIASKIPALKYSNDRIKIVFLMTACKKVGPTQQTLNIIKNLDYEKFDPTLITIYDEDFDSRMADFLPYVSKHFLVKTGKKNIILGQCHALQKKLAEIDPDIIHTVGVFPDYAVSKFGKYKQIHTLRNYVYDDFPAKFGYVRGNILARLQLAAMKNVSKTITCSESLAKIYKNQLGMAFDFIRNGVDVEQYSMATISEKQSIRHELGLPEDAFIWVYTGQFIERKNIAFLLENYAKKFGDNPKSYLLLLGGGEQLEMLKTKYAANCRIDFRGNVSNVNYYLKCCDAYISTSKSEGLPNGVLEAMATGLPVVLSDIEQHKEIFEADSNIGYLYKQNDENDFIEKLLAVYNCDIRKVGQAASNSAHENFNSVKMSKKYQKVYEEIVKD